MRFFLKVSKNTNWLLLVLLIFAGQTMSVPFTSHNDCDMDHSSAGTSDHSMPDHDMSNMDMSMDMTKDCCADDCQCSDGMCLSTVFFFILENNMQLFVENTVIFHKVLFKTVHRSSSIYRPPILS